MITLERDIEQVREQLTTVAREVGSGNSRPSVR